MESVTKRKLQTEQIISLVNKAFDNKTEVKEIKELTDGYFNISYLITLNSGKRTVLKISPKEDVKVLSYERDLMKTEIHVLNKLSKQGLVPVPFIEYYDYSRSIIDSDYFFMNFIDGTPLDKVKDKANEKQIHELSKTLGTYAKQINNIKGTYFGFINIESRRYDSWNECFKYMVVDLMDDAKIENITLPITKDESLNIINKYSTLLKEVKNPSLIHKDLWDGNIFVNPDNYEVIGIIDCERAIYGDPLLDAVCGFLDDNTAFMNSFLERKTLSENEKTRILLYKFYLFLLMVVEAPYRQYDNKEFEEWARNMLLETLAKL